LLQTDFYYKQDFVLAQTDKALKQP